VFTAVRQHINMDLETKYSTHNCLLSILRHVKDGTHRLALLVLAPVQHSPVDLSGVPLGQEGRLALGVQKLEHLAKKDKDKLNCDLVGISHRKTRAVKC